MQEQYNRFPPLDATPPRGPSTKRAIRGGDPLGTIAKLPTTLPKQGLSEAAKCRYHFQDCAAVLLPKERVSSCLRRVIDMASGVTAKHIAGSSTAVYSGLQTCSSVWMCPCCAAKVTERRRLDELQPALRLARDCGLRVVMVTLTFEHHAHQPLQDLLHRLMAAHEALQSGGQVTRMNKRFNVLGFIRALEVTYSTVNGWHPHIHLLVFLDQDANIENYGKLLRRKWERALVSQGLSCNVHGFRLDDCDARIADYIAKYGHEPMWDEAAELSKWHVKKGRGATLGDNEHVTPFGLLKYASEGDTVAGALFVEYAQAFKGRQQLKWSTGLKKFFGVDEKTDEEIAEEEQEQTDFEVSISRDSWQVVLGNDARYEFLRVVAMADAQVVQEFLDCLGITDGRIYTPLVCGE